MRIKLDENLPADLVTALRALGHDVESVNTEGLSGHPDPDVWSAAQSERRILITQDIRFGDARMFTPGQHAGFVLVEAARATPSRVIRNTQANTRAASSVNPSAMPPN